MLEDLDCIPALLIFIDTQAALNRLQRILYVSGIGHLGRLRLLLGSLDGSVSSFLNAFAFQSRDLDDFAAQAFAQLLLINLITSFADQVRHVQRDDHRNSCFC